MTLQLSHIALRCSLDFFFCGERSSVGNSVGVDSLEIDPIHIILRNKDSNIIYNNTHLTQNTYLIITDTLVI